PMRFIERGGFRFADSQSNTEEERKNPWLLLDAHLPDAVLPDGTKVPVEPVVGEQNSVQWILHKGLGEDIDALDENGRPIKLRIIALLQNSIFQSSLILADEPFRKYFPTQEGTRFFLIDTDGEPVEHASAALEAALHDQGFEAASTVQRLQSYQAVEYMYLSSCQALGALGLLLGAVGLAVVLLRGVWERRAELALLRALGYRRGVLGRLLLTENGFLLAVGLGCGVGAALLAVLPHLLGHQAETPWLRLPILLGLVVLVGLGSAGLALAATLRAPLLPALRRGGENRFTPH